MSLHGTYVFDQYLVILNFLYSDSNCSHSFLPQAQKGIAALEPDPGMAAQVMIMQKVTSSNGVPAMEIGRVLADGADSKALFDNLADAAEAGIAAPEFKGTDVEPFVKAYENLGLKHNRRDDIIEHIDRDLIQVS